MRRALLIALLLPAIASARQQLFPPVRLTPPSPTAGQVIRARIPFPGNCGTKSASTVVDGTTVRTTVALSGCEPVDPPFDTPAIVDFGPLAPGTYTYEIYYTTEGGPLELRSTQTFTVSTPIPTLSERSLMLLAVALAAAAIIKRLS